MKEALSDPSDLYTFDNPYWLIPLNYKQSTDNSLSYPWILFFTRGKENRNIIFNFRRKDVIFASVNKQDIR